MVAAGALVNVGLAAVIVVWFVAVVVQRVRAWRSEDDL